MSKDFVLENIPLMRAIFEKRVFCSVPILLLLLTLKNVVEIFQLNSVCGSWASGVKPFPCGFIIAVKAYVAHINVSGSH